MKRLRETNINAPEYTDNLFINVDRANTLRQDKYLSYFENGSRVVELGCGSSYFPQMAAWLNESWAIDWGRKTVERMAEQFPGVNYLCGDVLHTPFTKEFFNVVVAGELIEHIEEPKDLVKEMVRICMPGGKMILSTPHLEFDDPEHIWEFEESDLHELFEDYGKVTTETIKSEKFPGREYIFMVCQKTTKSL